MRKPSPRTRFLRQIHKTEGCWYWMGCWNADGYGRISINGRPMPATRLAYQLFKGDVPKGMFVCHKCDDPRCVRPGHLWLGTPKDNALDAKRKGRLGHPKGSVAVVSVREVAYRQMWMKAEKQKRRWDPVYDLKMRGVIAWSRPNANERPGYDPSDVFPLDRAPWWEYIPAS